MTFPRIITIFVADLNEFKIARSGTFGKIS